MTNFTLDRIDTRKIQKAHRFRAMGKIQNKKFRAHQSAVKPPKLAEDSFSGIKLLDSASFTARSAAASTTCKKTDVNALIKELTAELEAESDARSVVTSRSLREASDSHLKKKDKNKVRHAVRLKQLLLNKAEREEEKKRKKREATAVVGDMKPLEDALPTLQWLIQNCSKTGNPAQVYRKPRNIEKQNVQKKKMVEGIELLRAAAASRNASVSVQSNPFQAIAEELRESILKNSKTTETQS